MGHWHSTAGGEAKTHNPNVKMLRHTFAVGELLKGRKPEVVAKQLGHVDTDDGVSALRSVVRSSATFSTFANSFSRQQKARELVNSRAFRVSGCARLLCLSVHVRVQLRSAECAA